MNANRGRKERSSARATGWSEGKRIRKHTKRIQTGKGRNVWRKQAVTLSFSIVLDSSHTKLNKLYPGVF